MKGHLFGFVAGIGMGLWALAAPALAAYAPIVGPVSVLAYGAVPSASVDNGPAIQAAVNAVPSGGTIAIPAGTFGQGTQVNITKPLHIDLYGTIQFTNNAAATSFYVTSANVTIECHGIGGFNGVDSTHGNWQAVDVVQTGGTYAAPFLVNDWVKGCNAQNMGVGVSTNQVFTLQGVQDGGVEDSTCGAYGGYCFYGAYNKNVLVTGLHCEVGGYTCTSNSGGTGFKVAHPSCYESYFCFKGGYGSTIAVTADCAPAATYICVTSAGTVLQPGVYMMDVSASSFPLPGCYIQAVVNHTTYQAVVCAAAYSGTIAVGDQMLNLETNSTYSDVTINGTSNNAFDMNGVRDLTIRDAWCFYCGQYNDSSFLGDIWIGFDPYNGNTNVNSSGILIDGFHSQNSYATAISLESGTYNAQVTNFDIESPGGEAITENEYTYQRATNFQLTGGLINATSVNDCVGAWYSSQTTMSNLQLNCYNGVNLVANSLVLSNFVNINVGCQTSTCYGFVLDSNSSNHNAGIVFRNDLVQTIGATETVYGIWCNDTGATNIQIPPTNAISGTSSGFATVHVVSGCQTPSYTFQSLP